MRRFSILSGLSAIAAILAASLPSSLGQDVQSPAADSAAEPAPVTFTTQQDHRNMMEQLGITKLRPGPSGNPSAPNSANYDESKANPYPELPALLKLNKGDSVMSAEMWWTQRRPEIVEHFEREVYGRVPDNVPKVTWEVIETRLSSPRGPGCVIARREGPTPSRHARASRPSP